MQQQLVGHQMMSQSPSGAWRQRHADNGRNNHNMAMMMQKEAMNNATKHYGNNGGNIYNYQPSYGNGPGFNNPVYHDGIAYYYPSKHQHPSNVFQQQGSRNLSQQYNHQIGF